MVIASRETIDIVVGNYMHAAPPMIGFFSLSVLLLATLCLPERVSHECTLWEASEVCNYCIVGILRGVLLVCSMHNIPLLINYTDVRVKSVRELTAS